MLNSYSPMEVESIIACKWNKNNFDSVISSQKETYIIMMPPPNVTGVLHIGHAFNFTLQDIIIRFQRMKGRHVLWQAGLDHAGIAAQMLVERFLEKESSQTRQQLGREAFIKKMYEWRDKFGNTIIEQSHRLGVSCNWNQAKFTMDPAFSEAVKEVFVQFFNEGIIYQDDRLVNWDSVLHTAISDLEVVMVKECGKLWYIRYDLSDSLEEDFIVIATTRPETLFGDVAIAVHPQDSRYKAFIGKKCIVPLINRSIPIIADFDVKSDFGTGALKITPAHDFHDFEIGKRHGLQLINILHQNMRLNDKVPKLFQGLLFNDARKLVLEQLIESGYLVREEIYEHAVPRNERGGAVVEPFLTRQWFVDSKKLAGPAIEAVDCGQVKFFPSNWKNTYFDWMKNIKPWCISRQLWWGHQIPAWYGPDKKVFVAKTEEDAMKQAYIYYGHHQCLERDPDVLDTWFSSALWPFVTLGWPSTKIFNRYPTDLLITGFDIIFFWVSRMIMMSIKFMNNVPFRHVYIHPLVRDKNGVKMSKTKGNVIDPLSMIDLYGADALRFAVAFSATPGRDVRFSENYIKGFRNFGTKIWNAARFAQKYNCIIKKNFNPKLCENVANRFIISRLYHTIDEVDESLQSYRFDDASKVLYRFIWHDICDGYIEFCKYLFQSSAMEETKTCFAWILYQTFKILHPFMPFLTEYLFDIFSVDDNLLMYDSFPISGDRDEFAISLIECTRLLIAEIRIMRSILDIYEPMILYVESLFFDKELVLALGNLEQIFFGIKTDHSVKFIVKGYVCSFSIEKNWNIVMMVCRTEKKLEKTMKEHSFLQNKINDLGFIKNAPESMIQKYRERIDCLEQEINKSNTLLQDLKNTLS